MAGEEQEELSVRQETPSLLQFDKKTDAKVVEAKKKSKTAQPFLSGRGKGKGRL